VSRSVVAAYLSCAFIWGTTWYGIRVCIADYPTFAAVALRFTIAVLLLLPLAARKPWPRGKPLAYLVIAGVLDAAAYLLVYLGEERIPGGLAAVLYGTQPLILALLLSVARIERITHRHLIGAIVSLAGVIVLFLDRLHVSTKQAIGVVMVIGSVVVATTYSMIMKQHAKTVHNLVATTIFLGVTAFALGVVAFVAADPIPWPLPLKGTFALGYLAIVGTVVAFLVYFWLLNKTGLLVTSTLVFVYPLVAIVTDRLFEHELPLAARSYVGVAITLGGLAVSLRGPVIARQGETNDHS